METLHVADIVVTIRGGMKFLGLDAWNTTFTCDCSSREVNQPLWFFRISDTTFFSTGRVTTTVMLFHLLPLKKLHCWRLHA